MLRRPHSVLVRGSKAYFGIGGFPITPEPYYRRVRSLACWPRGRSEPYNPATEMRDGPLRGSIRRRAEEEAVRSEDRSAARPRAVVINLRMRYVALWKQNGRVANDGSQRRGITALQRKPAVPVHRQKRQAECVLRCGDAVVAVFQPYDREGFGATLAKCADTVNFCE